MERQAVVISEVDVEQRRITVMDKTGRNFQLDFPYVDVATSIPSPEEVWTIYRDNGFQWFLDQRLDQNGDRIALKDLNPGDSRVRARATLHLDAEELRLNDQQIGVTTWEKFIRDTEQSDVILSHYAISLKSMQIFFNGVLVDPESYARINLDANPSADPRQISFALVEENDTVVTVYYQYTPEI